MLAIGAANNIAALVVLNLGGAAAPPYLDSPLIIWNWNQASFWLSKKTPVA
jgi:hypothetical protein